MELDADFEYAQECIRGMEEGPPLTSPEESEGKDGARGYTTTTKK